MAEKRLGADVKGAFGLALFLIVVAALIDVGAVGWLVAPFALGLLAFAMARSPVRYSLMALMFCAFTLENPSEAPAVNQWRSPLYPVGAILLNHLNNITGVRALVCSGIDILFIILFLIILFRKLTGSKVDRAGAVPTPQPLIKLAYLSIAGTLYCVVLGMLKGGEMRWAMWQTEKTIYLPLLFLFFQYALRGPQDHLALAKILIAAATVRAIAAVFIINTVVPPVDPLTGIAELPYATTHHDSILFASAFVLLVSLMLERVGKKATRTALLVLPILIAGMVANNRRMVWVQVAIVFITLYLATPDNPMKRKVRRLIYVLSPAIAGYIAVGWDMGEHGIWKPVAMMRSVVEPATDSSSLWREMENYNILFTFRQHPMLGTGYGHGFWEVIPLPSVAYDLERYVPHNGVLGLWMLTGYLGFTAISLLWAAGVYFSMRAYHAATRPSDRSAALMGVGAVIIYMVQSWGDLGLGSWGGVFTMAASIAVAGKLAVATGAWKVKGKRAAGAQAQTGTPPFATQEDYARRPA